MRYGTLVAHRRTLDLRAGVLRREVHWRSPAGREIKVRSVRLVSFVHRSVAAIRYEVAPLDGETRIVVQSELVANEDVPVRSADPRAAAILRAPLVPEWHGTHELRAVLVHRTRQSALRMAAGMDHMVEGPQGTVTENESFDDIARVTVSAEVGHGETLTLTKYLAYGWSSQRSMVSIRDQADAALASARRTGFDGLLDDQREYLDDFWERADVEIDGDDELQQAVRFALFHTLQSAARAETRAIAAKGLTGDGYDGHVFWDTESFVLPVLTYTAPETVRDALAWRHSTLDLATERARQLRLDGATFPWRTIRGHECSAYWPAGTAAFHVNADIADAVLRYLHATDDDEFARGPGLELLVATARLWRSLGHHDAHGAFHIEGVTGPDEYSAIADDNVYTNLMAARNLAGAAESCKRHREEAAALGVGEEEMAAWRDAAAAIAVPYDDELGVHQQSAGYTRHERWDFEATAPDEYPLLLHFPYFDLYRKQVVKQADLVLAMIVGGRSLHGARQGAGLRVLRAAHGARLVAVRVRAGHHGRRGRPPRAGLRLLRRGRADGPRRPRAQHPRRPAHGLAGGLVAGGGGRVRRLSRPPGRVLLRPAAAAAPRAPGLRAHAARPPAARGDPARRGALRAGRRRAARAAPRRHAVHARARESAGARVARAAGRRGAVAAPASRAHPAPAARVRLTTGAVLRWLDRGLPPPQARRKTLPGPRLRGVFLVRPRP